MHDPRLQSAEKELLKLRDSGESPSWEEFAGRYPHDLDSLKRLFDRLFHAASQITRRHGSDAPFVTFYDWIENRPVFSVVVLSERTLKFLPGGYCNESLSDVDEELVCVFMDDEGVVHMQPPSIFFDR